MEIKDNHTLPLKMSPKMSPNLHSPTPEIMTYKPHSISPDMMTYKPLSISPDRMHSISSGRMAEKIQIST